MSSENERGEEFNLAASLAIHSEETYTENSTSSDRVHFPIERAIADLPHRIGRSGRAFGTGSLLDYDRPTSKHPGTERLRCRRQHIWRRVLSGSHPRIPHQSRI